MENTSSRTLLLEELYELQCICCNQAIKAESIRCTNTKRSMIEDRVVKDYSSLAKSVSAGEHSDPEKWFKNNHLRWYVMTHPKRAKRIVSGNDIERYKAMGYTEGESFLDDLGSEEAGFEWPKLTTAQRDRRIVRIDRAIDNARKMQNGFKPTSLEIEMELITPWSEDMFELALKLI